jgi:DNA-binding NarL/FixJ family response regulator
MTATRVLIVDDDALVRGALSMMLSGAKGFVVVGEAGDGAEVTAVVEATQPDVVLMDIRMPRVDGITATGWVRQRPYPPEVVVLTTFDADENVLRALRAGAAGFLLKDTPPERIVDAIRKVAAGDPMLSPGITRRLIDLVAADDASRERANTALAALTEREHDVVLAVTQGKSNAQIAEEFFMSVATVKSHVSRILTKLHLDNRTQIALLGHDAGVA